MIQPEFYEALISREHRIHGGILAQRVRYLKARRPVPESLPSLRYGITPCLLSDCQSNRTRRVYSVGRSHSGWVVRIFCYQLGLLF
jgi:hypothetical protein